MSWRAVAKKDFRDAVRSRALWVLSAVFLLVAGGTAVAYARVDAVSGGDPTATGLIFFVANAVGTFVSIAAILACYKAVAGERERGTIKITMSLPHTRRDVIVGKLVGRTAVLALPVVGTLLLGVVLGGVLIGEVAVVETALLGVVALLFTLTYAGVMVGLSATTGSTMRATTLTVGFFLLIELLWDVVVIGITFVTNGFSMPRTVADFPAWIYPVSQIPPSASFLTSLTAVIPDAPTAAAGGTGPAAAQLDAFYASPWVGVVALVFWLVVPILIGYWRFENADL
jgi:ABC-2 type transport system permease protein